MLHCERSFQDPATLRSARSNSDYGQPYDYFRPPYGEIIQKLRRLAGIACCRHGSADGVLYFCPPSHRASQSRAYVFDWMLFGSSQQLRTACPASLHRAVGAKADTFNCLAYPRWNSLSQAPIYRRYPSVQRGNGEFGGTTGAKTNRQHSGPGTKSFHFVAQTQARHHSD